MKQKHYIAGLYYRLSQEDERQGESVSIDNQRTMLRKYAEEHGFEIHNEYIDDGVSGTTFDRPEVQRLLDDAKTGVINTIIVKDLSRIGRAVFCLIEPEPCCGHLNFECSSLSANQRFQHIHDLAILNVGGVGKLLAVLLPHGFEFPAALDVVQNGRYIRNLTSCAAMGCGGT